MGEHAGVRRAPYDEDACAKLGGSARRRQKASAVWAVGKRRKAGAASAARATEATEAATTQAPTRGTCGGAPQDCAR